MKQRMRFGTIARQQMAEFRRTLSHGANSPMDDKGKRHGHLLAHGHEEENLIPELRGESGAKTFFRDRAIKWWTNARSGDRPTGSDYEGPTRNLASSQVSCVNFLLPLGSIDGALLEFIRAIDDDVIEIDTIVDQAGRRSPVEFEWVGWDKPLEGGRITRGANQTSVDALIVGGTSRGRRAYLLEWKYCEECLHPEDKGLGLSGVTRRSRYESLFSASDSPFKSDASLDDFLFEPFYQIMRMHLLGATMIRSGVAPVLPIDEARVVVVCPEANEDYRTVVSTLPLARRFSDRADVESVVRASLREPESFSVVGQEHIVAHLRRKMPVALKNWLRYHELRYGW